MPGLPKDMPLKNLLMLRFEWMEDELLKRVARPGQEPTSRAESRALTHLSHADMSIAELARTLGITRQAAHRTVSKLIAKGKLVVVPHPTNARVKRIRPSDALTKRALGNLDRIEAQLAQRIGKEDLARLRKILAKDWG